MLGAQILLGGEFCWTMWEGWAPLAASGYLATPLIEYKD